MRAPSKAALLRAGLFAVGVGALVAVCLYAQGGREHLTQYSAHFAHKLTARALMRGRLAMDPTLFGVTMADEQVYNGAGFTNWGFGVPLLQIPFHALVPLFGSHITSRYFPDRLIFFLYLAGLVPLLWTSFVRASLGDAGVRPAALATWLCSWSAALLALACAVFPLLAYRFIVYEETIAYFVVAQLYALSLYIRFVQSKNAFLLCTTAIAAGIGLLVRPTGLPYVALWGALCMLSDRRWRTAAIFGATVAPAVAFWLYSNWVKGGSPWTLGYQNTLPESSFHYAMWRFGTRCEDVRSSLWTSVKWLFEGLFLRIPAMTPVQSQCHYVFETHTPGGTPYFSPTVLVVLCGSLLLHATRRRSVAYYLPHAAFVALFFSYARDGDGFADRYTGDFWPLVILILVHLAPAARLDGRRLLGVGLALGFGFFGIVRLWQDVAPVLNSIAATDGGQVNLVDEEHDLLASEAPPMLPQKLECGETLPTWPRANGKGWQSKCQVDTFTNLFLGVRRRTDTVYHLRFKTDHPLGDTLRVYINAKYYDAHLDADGYYVVEFDLQYKRLRSPAVMVTVEWTRDDVPPPVKLMEMELG